MEITETQLRSILPKCTDAGAWCEPLNDAMARFEIDNPYRVAAFVAQIGHESGQLQRLRENLNYSTAGLLRTWPTRFSAADAVAYQRQPEKIANRAYANRMGNGDEASGDGWRYRGRGLIQITGRSTYRDAANSLVLPLLEHPELLEQRPTAALSAAWYWKSHLLNGLADHDGDDDQDFVRITKKINGGTNGMAERRAYWQKARATLGLA